MGAAATIGTAVAAALCCLAIPLTAGIIGLSGLAAFGVNLGIVAFIATALTSFWIIRTRSHDGREAPGDEDR
jgi:membrane protein implicated in regulation of membrane protease activity